MSIDPTVGEIIEAARLSESKFNSLQSQLNVNVHKYVYFNHNHH